MTMLSMSNEGVELISLLFFGTGWDGVLNTGVCGRNMPGDHGPGVSHDDDDWCTSDGRLRPDPGEQNNKESHICTNARKLCEL